jgi:anti-sigma factor RsiW
MNPEVHVRAQRLIDAWQVEGIPAHERDWLDAHLAECAECQARVRANERALQLLRSNAVRVDPALVAVTQARVRARAQQLREKQARLRALWIACALSWLMGAVTAPLLWQAFSWLGQRFHVSQAISITLFAFCWIAPAMVVGAVLAWQYSHSADADIDSQASLR